MLNDPLHCDRRQFLQSTVFVAAGLSVTRITGYDALALAQRTGTSTAANDRILVIVDMLGGNDTLNTIVPAEQDHYYRSRPQLAIPRNNLLMLDNDLGIPAYAADIKNLYDDGALAIINGVGYPDPDRSHFRSREIWHTASDADRYEQRGWIAAMYDHTRTTDALQGVAVSNTLPQMFQGSGHIPGTHRVGVAFLKPDMFRWHAGRDGDDEQAFASLNKTHATTRADHEDPVYLLRAVTSDIVRGSRRVQKATRHPLSNAQYPNSRLAGDLKTIARLIDAGLPTNVYYVSLDGFDTHANQPGQHERLITDFSRSVTAFWQHMNTLGHHKRIMIMSFSEFGRRVAENGSRGTDHGTAGSMFILADGLHAGMHGRYPSLDNLDDNGDLRFTVDFRTVYATVLEQWMQVHPAGILGRPFRTLRLTRRVPTRKPLDTQQTQSA